VRFIVRATPRIEINSVDDICMLLNAGVVSFDNAMHLSNMILGIDLHQGLGEKANAGQFARAFMTPSNKKDMITATHHAEARKPSRESAKDSGKTVSGGGPSVPSEKKAVQMGT
jgi:hypothetical protein